MWSKISQMKATLRLKLHTDPTTHAVVLETLRQATSCFNTVCRYGWEHDERNGVRLHQATYQLLRDTHPNLPSQLVISARVKATDEAVKSVRRRVKHVRCLLQSKGTRSAKRHLKKIRQKQSRFVKNTNHVVAKSLVCTASQSRKALALEDLSGIRDRADTVSRDVRWLLGNWAFLQLRQFIRYKAEAVGVPVVLVDPRNTSRTCSACGYCAQENRKNQSLFHCQECGLTLNADYNAAWNVKARASLSERLLCRSEA
jgi:IS605 OrfB family transposase